MADNHDLSRFVEAQDQSYAGALDELRRGRKTGHWMWFIFPQIEGLGSSDAARRYAIRSLDEARAYLAHPLLGQRLHECVRALQDLPFSDADRLLGSIDAMKLRSSLTLFFRANEGSLFEAAIDRWFDGTADASTDRMLQRS